MPGKGVIFAVVISGAALAQGLSTDAGHDLVTGAGADILDAIGNGFDTLDPAVRELLAPMLASWVVDARDMALQRGVERVSPQIREAIGDFVPSEILDDVRWRVEEGNATIERSLFRMSATMAVTLDDVILFASRDDAADPKLWAHELYHVKQYREWGVDGFVARYLEDSAAVERDAWEFRWQWMKATGRVPPP